MSQSNEALAAEQPVEQEEQQQPEPQGLMETQPKECFTGNIRRG